MVHRSVRPVDRKVNVTVMVSKIKHSYLEM